MNETREDKKVGLFWKKINDPFFNYAKMSYTYVLWYVEKGVIQMEKSPVVTHRFLYDRELAALRLNTSQKQVFNDLIDKSRLALNDWLRDKCFGCTGWFAVDLHSQRKYRHINKTRFSNHPEKL